MLTTNTLFGGMFLMFGIIIAMLTIILYFTAVISKRFYVPPRTPVTVINKYDYNAIRSCIITQIMEEEKAGNKDKVQYLHHIFATVGKLEYTDIALAPDGK